MPGLGNRSTSIFLYISDGYVVRRFKEPTKGSKERVLKKGPNAGKTVHEEHYDFIEGAITNITVKKGEYGKTWNVKINANGTDYILQLDYSSGYSSAFLKTLPNIDFAYDVKLAPQLKVEGDKKKATIFVSQNDTPVKWFFTKDNPGDLPQMTQIKVKGELKWDDSDMMEYLEKMVNEKIRPLLNGGQGAEDDDSSETTSHLDENTKNALNTFVPEDGPPPHTAADDLPF
jgi:hypothetical protein